MEKVKALFSLDGTDVRTASVEAVFDSLVRDLTVSKKGDFKMTEFLANRFDSYFAKDSSEFMKIATAFSKLANMLQSTRIDGKLATLLPEQRKFFMRKVFEKIIRSVGDKKNEASSYAFKMKFANAFEVMANASKTKKIATLAEFGKYVDSETSKEMERLFKLAFREDAKFAKLVADMGVLDGLVRSSDEPKAAISAYAKIFFETDRVEKA